MFQPFRNYSSYALLINNLMQKYYSSIMIESIEEFQLLDIEKDAVAFSEFIGRSIIPLSIVKFSNTTENQCSSLDTSIGTNSSIASSSKFIIEDGITDPKLKEAEFKAKKLVLEKVNYSGPQAIYQLKFQFK